MTERSEKKSGGRKLLPLIIILITLAVVGLPVVIGFVTGIFGSKFRTDEALNESKYFSYEEAGYSINGDGVIFDRDGKKSPLRAYIMTPEIITNTTAFLREMPESVFWWKTITERILI